VARLAPGEDIGLDSRSEKGQPDQAPIISGGRRGMKNWPADTIGTQHAVRLAQRCDDDLAKLLFHRISCG
jgi:hypothetical protein